MKPTITIKVEGAQKSGKTTIAWAIADFLESRGFMETKVIDDPPGGDPQPSPTKLHQTLVKFAMDKMPIEIKVVTLRRSKE
jgi:thymidylate kinase